MLEGLLKAESDYVYFLGMRCQLAESLSRNNAAARDRLRKDVLAMVRYAAPESRDVRFGGGEPVYSHNLKKVALHCDYSNTHFAILGVWAGVRGNVEVPSWYWAAVRREFEASQRADGGWDFVGTSSTKSATQQDMTAAGLANLCFAYSDLAQRGPARCVGEGEPASIRKALAWLDKHFDLSIERDASARPGPNDRSRRITEFHPRLLYAVEQAALATGRKYFGWSRPRP
jgi:hypothetical protein